MHCFILSVGLSLELVNNLGQSVGFILGLSMGQCLGLDVGFSMTIEVIGRVRPLPLLDLLITAYILITATKSTNITEITKRKISIQIFFLSGNRYTSYGSAIGGTDENEVGTHLALTSKIFSTLYTTYFTSTPPSYISLCHQSPPSDPY